MKTYEQIEARIQRIKRQIEGCKQERQQLNEQGKEFLERNLDTNISYINSHLRSLQERLDHIDRQISEARDRIADLEWVIEE